MNLKRRSPAIRQLGLIVNAILALFVVAAAQAQTTPTGWPSWLTTKKALAASAHAWSPDAKHLAYANENGLWTIDAPNFNRDTLVVGLKDLRQDAGSTEEIRQIEWSPDGRRIAFVAGHPDPLGGTTIWIVDSTGEHLQDLLPAGSSPQPGPQRRNVGIDAFLANDKIAYSMGVGSGMAEDFTVETSSDNTQELCMSRGPTFWSPDKTLMLAQNDQNAGDSPAGLGLFRLGSNFADFSAGRGICPTLIEGYLLSPCVQIPTFNDWSRNSKEVFFTKGAYLYQWNIDAGSLSEFMPNAECGSWAPNGRYVALIVLGKAHQGKNGELRGGGDPSDRAQLAIIDMPQRTPLALVRMPLGDETMFRPQVASSSACPKWSRYGKVLFFHPDGTVYLVQLEGSGVKSRSFMWPLPHGLPYPRWEFEWSPDGRWIAAASVSSLPANQPSLYVLGVPDHL